MSHIDNPVIIEIKDGAIYLNAKIPAKIAWDLLNKLLRYDDKNYIAFLMNHGSTNDELTKEKIKNIFVEYVANTPTKLSDVEFNALIKEILKNCYFKKHGDNATNKKLDIAFFSYNNKPLMKKLYQTIGYTLTEMYSDFLE